MKEEQAKVLVTIAQALGRGIMQEGKITVYDVGAVGVLMTAMAMREAKRDLSPADYARYVDQLERMRNSGQTNDGSSSPPADEAGRDPGKVRATKPKRQAAEQGSGGEAQTGVQGDAAPDRPARKGAVRRKGKGRKGDG